MLFQYAIKNHWHLQKQAFLKLEGCFDSNSYNMICGGFSLLFPWQQGKNKNPLPITTFEGERKVTGDH